MTGPALDLDALRDDLTRLREMADHARAYPWDAASWDTVADYLRALDPTVVSETASAVLALVEEQRAEIERLREAVKWARQEFRNLQADGYPEVLDDLAGSPAENKEEA